MAVQNKSIDLFLAAHQRAETFLRSKRQGPRAHDDLRAAVLFSVAAIDAYCRTKLIEVLRSKRNKNPNKWLSTSAKKLIRQQRAQEDFHKDWSKLTKSEQELVDAYCDSGKESLVRTFERALNSISFQNVSRLNGAMEMMGLKHEEVWGRFYSSKKDGITLSPVRKTGRPKKKPRGRPVDVRCQLERLFKRRHQIAHHADLQIQSRRRKWQPRSIQYSTVRSWLKYSASAIRGLDSILDDSGQDGN